MASSATPKSLQDSPENHGTVMNVVSWFLLVTSSLVVITRFGTKRLVSKQFHADDALIIVSQILGISQTIATSIAVSNGLARHSPESENVGVAAFQKALYATNILFVAGQTASKLSVVVFIRIISPVTLHRTLLTVIAATTILWALTSTAPLVFQCSTPRVWDLTNNVCISREAVWYYISTLNMLLDVCLVVLPILVAWQLQTNVRRKLTITSCFSARVLSMAAIGWQIGETGALSSIVDLTMAYWPFYLAMASAQHLGVITACAPYLKPFLDSLESGLIRSDDIRRRAGASHKSSSGYARSYHSGAPFSNHTNTTHPGARKGY
ncbi:hypothetical protein F4778DRAFT_773126 [Xylariomycetidae sp. FL2044]|nr:hypothetical protein F4778DRAFT_773126 [Xylariomycetidae sp. FL2044]